MDKVLTISHRTRRKAVVGLVAATIFASFGAVTALTLGRPVEITVANALLIGTAVGLFE